MLIVSPRRLARCACILLALSPAACADFRFGYAPNQFLGVWTTEDQGKVSFTEDTVVLTSPEGKATPVSAAECNGGFGFRYGQMTRESITGIAAAQPDVSQKLSGMLTGSVYPVAELTCDRGTSTYVMLDNHDLEAVYRDRDVVGLDRMTRP
ncbi:MAG TPA: hypothetical protein VGG57_09800 [Stellaceae bacterium]|jgi:hypothetical protein